MLGVRACCRLPVHSIRSHSNISFSNTICFIGLYSRQKHFLACSTHPLYDTRTTYTPCESHYYKVRPVEIKQNESIQLVEQKTKRNSANKNDFCSKWKWISWKTHESRCVHVCVSLLYLPTCVSLTPISLPPTHKHATHVSERSKRSGGCASFCWIP